jgi:hypothetical protein
MSTSTPTHRLRPTTIAKALGLLAVSTVPLLVRSGGAAAPAVTLESGGVTDADRAELLALVNEYAWLVDHARARKLDRIFSGEAELSIRGTAYRGPDGLTADAGWREQRSGRKTHHQVTNVRLEVVDRDHVTGTAGLVLHVVKSGSRGTYVDLVGEYHDEFVRTDSGWRIGRRRLVQLEDS